MNNLFEKQVAIVSDNPGTTTDPVTRTFELIGLGPVAVTDTAGFDDIGGLGELRIKKTFERIENSDIIIFTTKINEKLTETEKDFLNKIGKSGKKFVIALTFGDKKPDKSKLDELKNYTTIVIDNINRTGLRELKEALISFKRYLDFEITPCEGLVNENDLVILVTPIDLAAPKGRLILPQVETIRDLNDKDCASLVIKERELKYFYDNIKIKPKLVITDSQVFSKVAADIPENQLLTSFSILFARKKGDLKLYIEGIKQLKNTPENSKILVLESCSHHRQADDIGTVKIPRLFRQLVQPKAEFDFAREIPEDEKLKEYFMVINCAGCMATRNKILNRLNILKQLGIHATNYGLFLAWVNGLLPRALEPFPLEYELYNKK
jgi:[FeFe] hydrogenase H-cluster maturation GTPase HydF